MQEAGQARAQLVAPDNLTLSAWKETQWGYVSRTVTPGTVRAYRSAWTHRLEPALGSFSLESIRPFAIETAWTSWSGAWSTKNDAIALLSRLMSRAERAELILRNPVPLVEIGRPEKSDPVSRALEPAELSELFQRVPAGEYRRMLQAIGYLGLRFGEAAGLIVRDVDLNEGIVHVRRASSLDEFGRQEVHSRRPKGHGVRIVPILEQVRPVLEESVRGKGDSDIVFPGPRGGVVTSKNLARAIRWAEWRDEIRAFPPGEDKLRFHDLRHTSVTFYLRAGVPIHEVQRIMGHSSVQVTELYAHSDTERLRMAGAKLSGYLETEKGLGRRAA